MTISNREFLNDKFKYVQDRLSAILQKSAYQTLTNDLPIFTAFALGVNVITGGVVSLGIMECVITPAIAALFGYMASEWCKQEGVGGDSVLGYAVRFKIMGCGAIAGAVVGALKESFVKNYFSDNENTTYTAKLTVIDAPAEGRVLAM